MSWEHGFDDDVSGFAEVEVTNDKEVEKLGGTETLKQCKAHWRQLCSTDPRKLVLESVSEDRHLYGMFRSQFGLSIESITWEALHNPFDMPLVSLARPT